MDDLVLQGFAEAQLVLSHFIKQPDLKLKLDRAVGILVSSFESGIPIIACGNGGSTCDAMHFAQELVGRYCEDRPSLPALAISDPSYLTCVANDFGFEETFSRQVQAFGKEGGALLAISTSGQSKNVLKAVRAALERGMQVIGLTGQNGHELESLCHVCFRVPSAKTDRIQEVHIKIIHGLIQSVEQRLFSVNQ